MRRLATVVLPFVIFLFFFSSHRSLAQGWSAQSSGVANSINGVFLSDANNGTAVGASGKILHTTNGGLTWPSQTSGVSQALNSVWFTSASTGFIAGNNGTLLRTTSSGASWTSVTGGVSNPLSGIAFIDVNNGIAAGNGGTILRTTNGGSTWVNVSFGSGNLNAVSFSSASTATIVGNSGAILRSTNGGSSWSTQTSGTSAHLYGVSFAGANNGTAVGAGGIILRTTNGGTTWSAQTSGTSQNLLAVKFSSTLVGTAVGAGGTIVRTTNGGSSWAAQVSGVANDLLSVSFVDDNTGNAVGAVGTIIRTSTGGSGCAAITVAPGSLPGGTVGIAYSQTVTSSGGAPPYAYSVTSGVLPGGLTLSGAGVVSGTPSTPGTFSFTITSTDQNSCQGNQNYIVAISCASITVTPASLPAGTQGIAYSQSVSASGGTSPYTFSVTAGSLPAGLLLSSAGLLSGTPLTPGSYSFSVTATDANSCTGVRSYSVSIACPVITVSPPSLPAGSVGTGYSQTLSGSGGSAPYAFSITSGSLPAGLTLSSGGVISGTPTSTGSASFTVTATDANGCTGSRSYTIATSCPVITVTPASLPPGTVGTLYSEPVTASGGNSPYTFAVTAGTLPPGMTLSPAGSLGGTPTTTGTYSFTITATDAQGCAGSKAYSVNIACGTITLSPPSLPAGTTGAAYSHSLSSSGGTGPYTYAVSLGTLPNGISLSTAGVLSGVPTVPGSFNFSITATDAQGCTGVQSYTFTVNCPAITLLPASLPGSSVGSAYSQTITASGGSAPYSFGVTGGALPGGLSLSSTGVLSGTASASGGFGFTVTATDANGCTGVRSYSITIGCPAITLSSLTTGTVGAAYSQTITATGAAAPVTFAVTAGSLPAGLSLSLSGVLSGTPTVQGSSSFTLTATDDNGCTGMQSYTLSMNCPAIILSGLPNGTVGVAYSQTVTSAGGTAPSTYAVTSGTLPTGLSLSSGGVLSGTPASGGSFTFSVTGTDTYGCAGLQSYTLTFTCNPLNLSPPSLPNGTAGIGYSETMTGSGGFAPYTFAIAGGALPPGLTLSGPGAISGNPTTNGVYSFTISVTDIYGCSQSQGYTITIGSCPTITITPATLPGGDDGSPYTENLSASGGSGPYSYAHTAGTLPPGLTLSAGGTLSGSPSASGSYSFSVTATDNVGCTGSHSYTVVICAPIGLSAINNGTVGTPYGSTINATGGAAPYSFTLSSGSLPAGISLSAGGDLSGTPTAAGSSSFTISVTDANGCAGSQAYSVTMSCPAITINPSTLPGGSINTPYTQTLLSGGGTAPYAFSIGTGVLPNGLTLSSAGLISGTPATNGIFSFTVNVTDAYGCAGSKGYVITIGCASITLAPASPGSGTTGTPYSQTITPGGGIAPYTLSVASGSIPNGLTLLANGVLSGTPTASGIYTFTVIAIDGAGCSGIQSYALAVNCPAITVNPAALPNGTASVSYSQTVTSTGGTGPYTYAITSGSLPPGMVLTSAGSILGTPAIAGPYSFTVTATDANRCSGNRSYSLTIGCPALAVAPATVPGGSVGIPYSQTLTGSGGAAPYSFNLSSGTLPAGVTLSAGGVLSGIPTTTGSYSFSILVIDAGGCIGSRSYSATIGCPTITLFPAALPSGISASLYSQPVTAFGGTPPYTFALTAGSLPAGLVLASGGLISGLPANVGTFTFTVAATDAQGCTGSRICTLTVNCSTILPVATTPPAGSLGAFYSHAFTAGGGNSPYTFALTGGSLPAGTSLSPGGVLSGTPTVGGNFTFSITATDAAGCAGTQSYALTIQTTPGFSNPTPSINFGTLLVGAVNADSVVVTNPGTGTLTIYSAASNNGNFNVTPANASIAPGGSRKFYLTFAPGGTGPRSGYILFTHSAFGSPDSVAVTGTGVAPVFSILTSLSFGDLLLGTSRTDSVKIQNSGTTTLTISSAAVDNAEFSVSPSASSLPPGAIQTFFVTFTPTSIGSNSGNLVFSHNGAAVPNFVPVDGTGIVNLTVVKRRDSDGNRFTEGDQSPLSWHFSVYTDTVGPSHLFASADNSSFTTAIALPGRYIVCEADSAPLWSRINGNLTRFDTLVLGAQSIVDTFINFRINGITVRAFEDGDGIFATMGDHLPKQWHLEIRRDSLHGTLIASANAPSLAVPVLGDGTYYCIESDSANWSTLGAVVDGNPVSGTDQAVRVDLLNGQSSTVDFITARSAFFKSFRSFSPQSLAQLKPVKKKAAARAFCAQFVNTTGATVNGLRVVFTRNTLTGIVVTINAYAPFADAASLDGRTWNFTGAPISQNEPVTICGISNFGKEVQVIEWEWMVNGIPQARQPKFSPADQRPMLAMPNFANIRNEVFAQGGFSLPRADGLVVGIPRTDSIRKYGWVRIHTAGVLQKSLYAKTGYHEGFARGFDNFINGDPFIKEQKFLRPLKQNNRLFAEIVLTRFAITASALGITPNGFGELIYDDGSSNPLNGLTLSQITSRADSAMTFWRDAGSRGWSYVNFDTTLRAVNRAFDGPVDTSGYMAGMMITGVHPLVDFPFLHPNPGALPLKIEPARTPWEEIPVQFALRQNYPNPFNPSTTIAFDIAVPSLVTLKIYNILGQEVAAPVSNEYMDEGNYDVEFNANALASGVYFYRIVADAVGSDDELTPAGAFVQVKKMLLVK